MTIWVTSDLHFGHRNIAKYCPNRQTKSWTGEPTPESVQEMNEKIVQNWNMVVHPDDDVYCLGDCCMGRIADSIKHLYRLNGKKHLIKGNHDKTLVKHINEGEDHLAIKDIFVSVHDMWEMSYNYRGRKTKVFMCHYPMLNWPTSCEFALNGHTHYPPEKCVYSDVKQMDVGLDGHFLFPRKLNDVLDSLSNKKDQYDHHV